MITMRKMTPEEEKQIAKYLDIVAKHVDKEFPGPYSGAHRPQADKWDSRYFELMNEVCCKAGLRINL